MLFLKVEQDFTLLFGDETSSRLLQKWDVFFKPNIIQEAKQLTSTPELRRLIRLDSQSHDMKFTKNPQFVSEVSCQGGYP